MFASRGLGGRILRGEPGEEEGTSPTGLSILPAADRTNGFRQARVVSSGGYRLEVDSYGDSGAITGAPGVGQGIAHRNDVAVGQSGLETPPC